MRKTVEGLLVVHEHGHPHVLLLQVGNSYFKLPGDSLQPDEDEIFGLQQRMYLRLGPESGVDLKNGGVKAEDDAMNGVGSGGINDWTVGDAVGHFWRPNFETFMVSLARPSNLGSALMDSFAGSTLTCQREHAITLARALSRVQRSEYLSCLPMQTHL